MDSNSCQLMIGSTCNEKGNKMKTNRNFNFTHFLTGAAIGAVTGLFLALQMSENPRKYINERAGKGFDSVTEQTRQLRERAGKIVEKSKPRVSRRPGNDDSTKEAERQDYEENKRENLGG